jgi:serine/threonine-protein kinase
MSLTPGTRFGAYEVLAPLGAGGMGEVFRARDSQLHREVALKVLPKALAADELRVKRFKREAQLLAALNHPGIAAIYGIAEHDGLLALVLELVEGQDLSERIRRGPLPVDEALDVGRKIAEALEEAHERGIVHRDLKPSNVKLTPDGKVKVLDFGLAKAFSDDPSDPANPKLSDSPTLTRQGTQAGMVMGTASYMSPEQARGKPVDKRTDVWAFGVVLYEMLTGKRLFDGETVSDVLASVLRSELDWTAIPATTPLPARRLLERCLERDPKRRLRDIGEARLALEGAPTLSRLEMAPISGEVAAAPGRERTPKGFFRSLLEFVREFSMAHPVATVFIVMILSIVLMTRRCASGGNRPPETAARRAPGLRLRVQLAEDKPLFDEQGSAAVLSPDGRTLAFVLGEGPKTSLRLRRLDALESTNVPESMGAKAPFFSPDGQWVGFFARGRLMKAPVTGGAPSEVGPVRDSRGGAWGANDTIVFAPDSQGGLMKISARGGTAEPLTTADVKARERTHRWPAFLPGGRDLLFAVQRFGEEYDESTIEVVSVKSKKRKLVHKGGAYPRFARSGHLLFARRGVLYAARFDPEELELSGAPRPVVEGLMASTGNEAVGDGSAQFDVSAAGALLYRTGRLAAREAQLQVLDAKGAPSFIDERKHVFFSRPRFSPDARKVAVDIDGQPGVHIWIYDLSRREHTRLTFDQNNIVPEWTPDGRFVTFISTELALGTPSGPAGDAIYFMSADGSGPAELLYRTQGEALFERSFSPDGRMLATSLMNEKTGVDIVLLKLDGPLRKGVKLSGPEPLVVTDADEAFPTISPDGKLLAYAASTHSGDWRVFVRPFPSGEGQREVGAGVLPRWSGDGRTLYYQGGGRLHSVPVEPRAGGLPAIGDARALFDRVFEEKQQALEGFYDAAPDGKRFAVIQFAGGAEAGKTDQATWCSRSTGPTRSRGCSRNEEGIEGEGRRRRGDGRDHEGRLPVSRAPRP